MTLRAMLAYIDPGSGTLLLQAILAGALGSLVCLKGFAGRLLGALVGRKGPCSEQESADS